MGDAFGAADTRLGLRIIVIAVLLSLSSQASAKPPVDRSSVAQWRASKRAGVALVVLGAAALLAGGAMFAHIGAEWHASNPLDGNEISASIALGAVSVPLGVAGGALWSASERRLDRLTELPPNSPTLGTAIVVRGPVIRF